MSEEENVISGVPQGTVLAAVLFVIMISDIDENVKKSIVRSFADDTRVNKMINSLEDIEEMQKDLENIYEWAEKNKMVFNEDKFEQMSFGIANNVPIIQYKTPSGEEIQSKDNIRDLGVIVSHDLNFNEHINKITTICMVIMGMLLRTFETREREPMIKMFNSYLRSKLEYCCIVWSPNKQQFINKIEDIQRVFTRKIDGMEGLNYHERLRMLNMFSLERRRERYRIIYGWQQIEGIKENVMKLRTNNNEGNRLINNGSGEKKGFRLSAKMKSKLYNSPLRETERAFNSMPKHLRNITEVTTDTFKGHLDKWLLKIPDQPKCRGYAGLVSSKSNTLYDQVMVKR